jgi:hypothetical protein
MMKKQTRFCSIFELGPTQHTATPVLHIKSTIPSLSYLGLAMADKNIILWMWPLFLVSVYTGFRPSWEHAQFGFFLLT